MSAFNPIVARVMSGAYLHLLLNHFPVVGFFFAFFFLAFAWKTGNETLSRAGMAIVVFTALITIPAYLSGEPAEEMIEHLPSFSEKMLSAHEEFAEKIVWLIWGTGIVAAVGLLISWSRKKTPQWILGLLFFLGLASFAVAAWTNKLGGQINHPEIREGETSANDDEKKPPQDYEIDKD